MKSRIWLSSPHMGGEEIKYINKAFKKNWIAPVGPNITQFESDLENYLGKNKHVCLLSSGTAAIHLGLLLLDVKKNDEVLCQSMTFNATANPIIYLGAKPIFIDSELETWNLCPKYLEKAIIDRLKKGIKPKAIIAVDLYGSPFKVEEILRISKKYNIPILEDSAEALGSEYKDKKCGNFGDISILSFNGNKIITTSGGGALITSSKKIKEKALFYSTQARDLAPHYQHSKIGYNYRISNISAGIGIGQLKVLNKRIQERRKNNIFYKKLFSNIKGVDVFQTINKNYFSNYWLSTIIIDKSITNNISREDLRISLERENIESRPLWKPMHLQPVFKNLPYYGEKNCEYLFKNGLCLPSGSNLTNDEKKRIKKVIKKLFKISF